MDHYDEYFGNIYNDLAFFVDVLPFFSESPAYPFGGFVVNISVSTNGHRDAGDKHICVVIGLGNYTGGQICLYEAKLVFDVRPGDFFIFPSPRLTHFNLRHTGTRCSLVLQTDRWGTKWAESSNYWKAVH